MTYFVVEIDSSVAGCGEWSRQATLYGADHSLGRDAGLLDAATDPARVRAMYTHADFARLHRIEFTSVDEPIWLGRDADDAYSFVSTFGIIRRSPTDGDSIGANFR